MTIKLGSPTVFQGSLSMGGTSMGIAGSMVEYDFWEKWLRMRVEDSDMSELIARDLMVGNDDSVGFGVVKDIAAG